MTDAERQALQGYLDRPLDDLVSELSFTDNDGATRSLADLWDKVAEPLRQRLCVEWNYCRVRQDARWENDLDLAAAVLAVISTRTLRLPFNVDLALLAVIVVKRGLDAFCQCW